MASSIDESPSNEDKKIKIIHKKVVKQHKSKADIKKESEELILKLRKASMERKKNDINKENLHLKKKEDLEERNVRIFKALYSTPFDASNKKDEEMHSLSNQSIRGSSSDSSKDSFGLCLPNIGVETRKNINVPKATENICKKTNNSLENIQRKTVSPEKSSSLLSISNDFEQRENSLLFSSKKTTSKESKARLKMASPKRKVCSPLSTTTSFEKPAHQQKLNHKMLTTAVPLTPVDSSLSPKSSPSNKSKSIHNNSQCEKDSENVSPGQIISAAIEKLNNIKKIIDIPSITFSCRNSFTNKIQFKFIHRTDTTLGILKSRLKEKYNFIGHLFYKGKELVGDDKLITEFNLPTQCELDILPQIVSGDYTLQQYSQMTRNLDQKRQFLMNIKDIMNGIETVKTIDCATKRAIAKFETMTDSQRRKFDSDMKEKITRLKEKRISKRLNKKSLFLTSVVDKNSKKKDISKKVLSTKNILSKERNSK